MKLDLRVLGYFALVAAGLTFVGLAKTPVEGVLACLFLAVGSVLSLRTVMNSADSKRVRSSLVSQGYHIERSGISKVRTVDVRIDDFTARYEVDAHEGPNTVHYYLVAGSGRAVHGSVPTDAKGLDELFGLFE